MKNFNYKTALLILFLSMVMNMAIGQNPADLVELLTTKKTYDEVVTAIDSYYLSRDVYNDKTLYRQYKKWMRWSWFAGNHLDEHGVTVEYASKNRKEYNRYFSKEQDNMDVIEGSGSRSNSGVWTSVGPFSVTEGVARVDRIAFHPTNAAIIYACTPAGGVFRTLNGGASWQPLNGFLPNVGVSGIIIDKDDPNVIYLLTGDGDSFLPNGGFVFGFGYIRPSMGILKSTDGGNTWKKHSDVVPPGTTYYGYKLIQLSDFHYRFFACTTEGLYRSNDYGLTWVQDETIGNQPVYDIEDAGNGYVYATTDDALYISTNWGNPFSLVPNSSFSTPPSGITERTSVAISPNSPNSLYVLFGGSSPDLLYRSDNNGTTFTLMHGNAPTTQTYMAGFAASPTNIATIIIGEITLQRSTNSGSNWNQVGMSVHADVHDLQFNPLNNNLYAGCDGGVYVSTDQGQNWSSIFNGVVASQFYHMTGVEGSNSIMIGGAQDNGILQTDNNGGSYRREWGGDGFESKYLNGNNNLCFSVVNTFVGKIQRTPYNSWDRTPPGSQGFYPTLAIHPTNDAVIYAGYSNGVFRSDNDGVDWTNKNAAGSEGGSPAGGLAVSVQQPDRIYAADIGTVWRSNNKGDNWVTISNNPGFPALTTSTPITDITTRSNNADEIWITIGGYSAGNKVYYSNNAGGSWSNFSASFPNVPVYAVKYSSEGDAYIGTDIGVFFMDYTMYDWVPFSNGLPLIPVTDLFINETNGTIKASTFGRGIWQSDLYSDCGPFLFLTGTSNGRNFYQSNGFIETSQFIPGSLGNELRLRTPSKVIFKPGFRINNGAYLHALIGNCGQGVFNLTDGSNTHVSLKTVLSKLIPSHGEKN